MTGSGNKKTRILLYPSHTPWWAFLQFARCRKKGAASEGTVVVAMVVTLETRSIVKGGAYKHNNRMALRLTQYRILDF